MQTAKLLKRSDVLSMVPMGKATLYRRIRDGRFPAPVKVGRSVYWRETDVIAWIDSLAPAVRA